MVFEYIIILMEIYMKEIFLIIESMVRENLFVVIKVISLVNGEMTCRMVMESIIKIFNQFIKEI
jgi:hypothetical protein